MEKTNQLFNSVNEGVSLLINRCAQLKQENSDLKTMASQLQVELDNRQKSFQELEENYRTLKVELALEGKTDTSALKNQIDELVKEVDRCIELLQK